MSNDKYSDEPSHNIPFYKVLETLEYLAGISEREAIRRSQIPRSTYRSWKYGTCEPGKRTYWRALTRVFKIPTDDLIWGPNIELLNEYESHRRKEKGFTPGLDQDPRRKK